MKKIKRKNKEEEENREIEDVVSFVKLRSGKEINKEDEKEFLDQYRLRNIITRYSDHIAFPVLMKKEAPAEKISEDEKIIDDLLVIYFCMHNLNWTRSYVNRRKAHARFLD